MNTSTEDKAAENKVTDKMLPWGTPTSCRWETENVDTNWTLNMYL